MTGAAAAAHLLVAVAAIDGLVAARLERNTRLASARAAGCDEHLAATAITAASARHRRFARRTALRTT